MGKFILRPIVRIINSFLPKQSSMNCLNLEDILKEKMHGISCMDRITMDRIRQKRLFGLSNMMMTGINLVSVV